MNATPEQREDDFGWALAQRQKSLAKHRVMAELEKDEEEYPNSLSIGQLYQKYGWAVNIISSCDASLLASLIEMMRQNLRLIRNMDFQETFVLIFGMAGDPPFLIAGLSDRLSIRGTQLPIGKRKFLHYVEMARKHWELARRKSPLLLYHEMAVVYYLSLLLKAVEPQMVSWDVDNIEQIINSRVLAIKTLKVPGGSWPRPPRQEDEPLWI